MAKNNREGHRSDEQENTPAVAAEEPTVFARGAERMGTQEHLAIRRLRSFASLGRTDFTFLDGQHQRPASGLHKGKGTGLATRRYSSQTNNYPSLAQDGFGAAR